MKTLETVADFSTQTNGIPSHFVKAKTGLLAEVKTERKS